MKAIKDAGAAEVDEYAQKILADSSTGKICGEANIGDIAQRASSSMGATSAFDESGADDAEDVNKAAQVAGMMKYDLMKAFACLMFGDV